ncbi:MAG: alpha/beta hydrolase [Candidatus Obscuribacterales bacterium]|nr:alpha/beta hydrolase [Candidatus Obscuribacterales bacterium]
MKKKIELILQHGWGFDRTSWRTWVPHLRENPDYELNVTIPDRGYFSQRLSWNGFQHPDCLKVLIAHSYGLHLVPENIFKQTDLLVAISSFSSFHSGEAIAQKRSRRTLRLMKERFEIDPMHVIDDFYSSCYSPLLTRHALLRRGGAEELNFQKLKEDLNSMDTNYVSPELLSQAKNVLFLHGAEDGIVGPEHSLAMHEAIPGSSLILFEGVGHALPFTHAAPCWLSIRQSLAAFSRLTTI